jgi:uncharacterized protein YabN with tetrapyrrole methylase and pyrophosphatase domain
LFRQRPVRRSQKEDREKEEEKIEMRAQPAAHVKRGSLVVVGTGHRFAGHITQETVACLRQADKILHVCHPLTQDWIKEINPHEESLTDAYGSGKDRSDTYEEMTERILAPVRAGLNVCAAFYGHPGVCAHPTREAIRRARLEGYKARMLPGISAEDALIADLNVDSAFGWHSTEATYFLIHKRQVDTSGSLILWQIGMIGVADYSTSLEAWNPGGVKLLQSVLRDIYSPRHKVIVYEASPYPNCDPVIQEVSLANLMKARITTHSTLYIPPRKRPVIDQKMVNRLKRTLS